MTTQHKGEAMTTPSGKSIVIGGVWLRQTVDAGGPKDIEVLVEVDGKWRLCITEHPHGPVSHIIEPAGIAQSPLDPLTESSER